MDAVSTSNLVSIARCLTMDKLLEKIRIVIAEQDEDYFGAQHIQSARSIKQRVAFDDIVQGLTCDTDTLALPEARLALFRQHCLSIQEACAPLFIKKQTDSICVEVNLPGNWEIILQQEKQYLILQMEHHNVTLKDFTLEELLTVLCQHNPHPDLEIPLKESSYRRLEWQGVLYNRTTKSWLPAGTEEPRHKGQPYRTITANVFPVNLNGEIPFTEKAIHRAPDIKIACRHLAFHFIKDCLEDQRGKGKIDWTLYSTPRSVKAHISGETDKHYRFLKVNAKRYDLIHNDKIGEYIQKCFERMSGSENPEAVRMLLVESTDHAMAIRLRIKIISDKPVYVVSFYDPNITNSTMRCQLADPSKFRDYTLKYCIDGSTDQTHGAYEVYYGKDESISMVTECDSETLKASLAHQLLNIERKLKTSSLDPIMPTYLLFLLSSNVFPDDNQLKKLKNIASREPEKLLNRLAEKNPKGAPGLFLALQNGHAEAIQMCGELLQLISKDKRSTLIDLLAAKKTDNTPGLFIALQEGHAEAIQMYGDLLKLIPEDKRAFLIDLLAAKNTKGTPGLFMALQSGHTKAIEMYGELLQLIPEDKRAFLIELLAAKNAKGIPGLFMALQNGHAKAVEMYGELLQLIPQEKRNFLIDLLASKNAKGISGLLIALQKGYAETIKMYGNLLQLIPQEKRDFLIDLLAGKAEKDGVPGLFMALQNGDAEAIKMYGDLLLIMQPISENKQATLVKLLAAKDLKKTPGLFKALQKGHAEAIKMYGNLLQLIPKDSQAELIDLLVAKASNNVPGLFMALQNGHAKAIEMYGELLQLIPQDKRVLLIDLLAAKAEKDGVPGLFMALQKGHAEAIKMYGNLLQLIPKDSQAELIDLLVSKKSDNVPGLYMALKNGHAETIQIYGKLILKLMPENRQADLIDLLVAKDVNGKTGLSKAWKEKHINAIRVYCELLQLIPGNAQATLLKSLDAKKIFILLLERARQIRDKEAAKIYSKLLKHL